MFTTESSVVNLVLKLVVVCRAVPGFKKTGGRES